MNTLFRSVLISVSLTFAELEITTLEEEFKTTTLLPKTERPSLSTTEADETTTTEIIDETTTKSPGHNETEAKNPGNFKSFNI